MDYMGFKEIYDCSLKLTSNCKINGREFEEGETIINFSKIQIAYLNEEKSRRYARGGKNNEVLITWENTYGIQMALTEGVISPIGLALISNSKIATKPSKSILVPYNESFAHSEDIEEGKYQIVTKYPIDSNLFVYRNGVKITPTWEKGSKTIIIEGYDDNTENPQYLVSYDFIYENTSQEFYIGERLINGYLSLTGKLRVKDDKSGETATCLVEIPKVKLMSDLSMRLGSTISPNTQTFNLEGFPTEKDGARYVCKFTMLDSDIDCDF